MIEIIDLPESAARHAMDNGEFPDELIGTGNVAVILTQNWCVEWLTMRKWLKRVKRGSEREATDIRVYAFIYNRVPFFREFMEHKEKVFGNSFIPYVRYYQGGKLIGESNAVGPERFFGIFGDPGSLA